MPVLFAYHVENGGIIHEQHVYRIAQHSKYYHKWTYESGNDWDIYGDQGATYGRIRR